jgi:D-alanyl-D-alanine carboxypeptidase
MRHAIHGLLLCLAVALPALAAAADAPETAAPARIAVTAAHLVQPESGKVLDHPLVLIEG